MCEIVLTSSLNGPITAYDAISGTTVARFTGSQSPRHGLAIVGKANYIAASHISSSATPSGSVHLYNWWSPTVLHQIPVPEPVVPLAATPDGLFVFAGGISGNVYALSIPSGQIIKSIPAHNNKPVSCIKISTHQSSLLISGGDDGCIAVMPILGIVADDQSDFILIRFLAHDGPVTSISSFTRISCPTIMTSSTDFTCKVWSLLDGRKLQTIAFPCAISGVALDPAEVEFYAAGSDGWIYKGILQVGSRKETIQSVAWIGKHEGGGMVSVAMANGGKNLVCGAEDGSVYMWEREKGEVMMVLGKHDILSDVIVGRGMGDGNKLIGRGNTYVGLSAKQVESMQIEDVLSVTAQDRTRAIHGLQSAIGVYQRLLDLILKSNKHI